MTPTEAAAIIGAHRGLSPAWTVEALGIAERGCDEGTNALLEVDARTFARSAGDDYRANLHAALIAAARNLTEGGR